MTRDIITSTFVESMRKQGFVEVARWPMHVPDEQIIMEIERDEKLSLYAAFGSGVPLFTFAGVKSFFAHVPRLSKKERIKRDMFNKRLQSRRNRAYNNKVLKAKRHQDQKDFDLSFLEVPSG